MNAARRTWQWMARLPAALPTYRQASFWFLRLIGLVYFCAFASLWVQVDGLIGSHGILPIAPLLDHIRGRAGFWQVPTLCWINASDASLHVQCAAGVGISILLMAGIAPALSSLLLWLLYLSLTVAGQVFLGYQWDALLLEAGFLAIWLSPLTWISRRAADPNPSPVPVFLLQALLFKLMFLSGYVKLASGDPSWTHLTALTYHYWTTCLPTWTGWYANQLPLSIQKLCCALMFAIEFILPFLMWGPGRILKWIAFGGLVGLQVLIALTGNYTFFNLLTLVLCVMVLDDRTLARAQTPAIRRGRPWPRWILLPVAIPTLLLSLMIFTNSIRWRVPWPNWMPRLYSAVYAFRSVNGYGLFASMTKSRTEIIVEGSNDGVNWAPYEFKWKPGDLRRRPGFVAPHQPRLDWQMWFAALSDYRREQWFVRFVHRLLEGSPPVLKLIGNNPFPDHPPRYIRATAWAYRFSTPEERRAKGTWWTRQPLGLYCPPVSLQSFEP